MQSDSALEVKNVAVTGASSGIGRETSRSLARGGGHVVLVAPRTEPLAELSAERREADLNAIAVASDLWTHEGAGGALRKAYSRLHRRSGSKGLATHV